MSTRSDSIGLGYGEAVIEIQEISPEHVFVRVRREADSPYFEGSVVRQAAPMTRRGRIKSDIIRLELICAIAPR